MLLLVGTYRETTRTDESVIHQEILDVAPGRYTLQVEGGVSRDVAISEGGRAVVSLP